MINILNFLSDNNGFDLLSFLILTTVKTSFLIGFAALLCRCFKRFSAANRHFIWSLVLIASLALPLLSFIKGWEIPVFPAQDSIFTSSANNQEIPETLPNQFDSSEISVTKSEPKNSEYKDKTGIFNAPLLMPNISELSSEPVQKVASSFSTQFIKLILGIWLIVVCLFLMRLISGIISTNRLSKQTIDFENPALNKLFSTLLTELNLNKKIRLRQSEKMMMPIVYGILRPVVILPSIAETWTDERCRVVLLHELTHIARRDCLTQILGQLACVFYWFNPFIWLAVRRLRIEREQACDEFVLSIGTKPSDYARHLLDIARSMNGKTSGFEWSPNATIAMAQPSQLEERLLAILNPKNHSASRFLNAAILLLVGVLFLSLATIRPITANTTNPQITETTAESQPENLNKQSLNYLLSTDQPQQQEKIDIRPVEKDKTEIYLDEIAEKQAENEANQQIKKENILTNAEQTTESKQIEKDSDLNVETNPAPNANPFVKAEFKQEQQTQKSDDYIDEMASVGYKNLSVEELIRLKAVGVTAEYVKALRSFGFDNLTVRELVNLRAVGITTKYIEEIRNAGYKELSVRELSNLKALDVSGEFINKFRNAGYNDLSVRDLTNLKASDMTLEYIETMNSLGFGKLTLKELTNLKFNGVTPEFVRLARSRLGNDLTLKQIVGLKNAGILKEKEKP